MDYHYRLHGFIYRIMHISIIAFDMVSKYLANMEQKASSYRGRARAPDLR